MEMTLTICYEYKTHKISRDFYGNLDLKSLKSSRMNDER